MVNRECDNQPQTVGGNPPVSAFHSGHPPAAQPCELRVPFVVGAWEIFPDQNLFRSGETETVVQPKTIRLLCVLANNAQETLSRDQLIDLVWGGVVVSDAAIDRVVCNLRKALNDKAKAPTYIQTVRKRGIRLMQPVEELPDKALCPVGEPQTSVVERASFAFPQLSLPQAPASARAIAAVATLVFLAFSPHLASTPMRVAQSSQGDATVPSAKAYVPTLAIPVAMPTFQPLLETAEPLFAEQYEFWRGSYVKKKCKRRPPLHNEPAQAKPSIRAGDDPPHGSEALPGSAV
ncbi:MAG: winged helix-turn-helix domain-containing protein [Pseudomonadota bacterium]